MYTKMMHRDWYNKKKREMKYSVTTSANKW